MSSPARFLAPEALIGKEGAQRGGHIPGARNIPWAKTVNDDDGTFKSRDELHKLYADAGVDLKRPTIAYCRIGERSSHTWFVLKIPAGRKRREELRTVRGRSGDTWSANRSRRVRAPHCRRAQKCE
jgi:3-mercaptopyruvate sulfurtransferase SseA